MATLRFGRYTVETSRGDKVLFPGAGLTKADVVAYYRDVAAAILPHLRERPLVLQRFPDGIGEAGFYQKQAPDHRPGWIATAKVTKKDGERQDLVVCRNEATLAWLADQAALVLHPWLARRDRPDHPDQLLLDLDPPADDFAPVRRAALRIRDLCDELELPCWVKTTGSRGVHVVAPLDRSADSDEVRAVAARLCGLLADRHPEELTTEQRRDRRGGRLYLDVSRNASAQSAVAAWSLRARPGAPVAVPLTWNELSAGGIAPDGWGPDDARRRLDRRGDPWSGFRRHARSLASARAALDRIAPTGN